MDAIQAKIMTMVTLGTSSIAAGLLPSWFLPNRVVSDSLVLSALLCFGGGILFATAMVHMLPEVHENVGVYAEILACSGFLLLYFIEVLLDVVAKKRQQLQNQRRNIPTYGTSEIGQDACSSRTFYPNVPPTPEVQSLLRTTSRDGPGRRCACDGEGSVCHVVTDEFNREQSASHFGLIIALSFHSILEGLAIGVQRIPGQVLLLGGAVASHKLVVAFGLGMELSASRTNSRLGLLMSIVLFAFSSVFGIGIGTIFVSNGENFFGKDSTKALYTLQGIAVGTLLYVTLSEVLPREKLRFHHDVRKSTGIVQFISVLTGFTIMTLLDLFIDPEEK